jgi:hypothetical protein
VLAQQQAEAMRPRPEISITDVKSTGGGGQYVTFSVGVVNRGSRAVTATVTARLGGQAVKARPPQLELLVNAAPVTTGIDVPRPQLGDLVHALNNVATLYGETLTVSVSADEHQVEEGGGLRPRDGSRAFRGPTARLARRSRRGDGEHRLLVPSPTDLPWFLLARLLASRYLSQAVSSVLRRQVRAVRLRR